ncbi:MAG: cardiolipin synthase [Proteobacteria bacterium]|nr:cardiolipin synthase [Pseudomonadota bacterium]
MTPSGHLAWLITEAAALAHFAIAGWVTVHVLLYKRNVGAAVSWIGIAWLSPFIGGLLYFAMGVNRVKRRAKRLRRDRSHVFAVDETPSAASGANPLTPLEYAIGRLTGLPAERGNSARMLRNGDEAYPAMLAAIEGAQHSIGLCSYIFRDDPGGRPFIEALARARHRGVQVRVLLDGIGSGYFWNAAYNRLRALDVPAARFLHSYFPWRTPFLNLRNHRKLMVVDGRLAYVGGINIGGENLMSTKPSHPVRDTHFQLEGPVVEQLVEAFADDWLFTTGEKLLSDDWFPDLGPTGTVVARTVTSGPDEDLEKIEFAVLHAISCARRSIRVVTPYFLPPEVLTTALGLAAMRGIVVDIVVPENSNHFVLDWARRVPIRPLLEAGCRVWLRPAPFDHSKLMTVDDSWSLIGSANWDTRSFRLNFELNLEVQDPEFARRLNEATSTGRQLDLTTLDDEPLLLRLRDSAARLLQPYL